jgi:integrase
MGRQRSAKKRGWPPNLYESNGYYSYQNPINGKRKGLGRDKAKAFSEARAANSAVAQMKESSLVNWVKGISQYTFKEWLPVYRGFWLEHSTPAASTISRADNLMERFKAAEFAWMPLQDITTVHISEYIDGITKNSGAGMAVNMRTRLMDIFNFAEVKGHVDRNPVAPTLVPKYEVKRERLSLEQFLAIREKASPFLANAMNLALLTAQRREDVANMLFADVQDNHLLVVQGKSQGKVKLKLDLNIRLEAVGMSIGDVIKACRNSGVVSRHIIHITRTFGHGKAGARLEPNTLTGAFSRAREAAGIESTTGTPPSFHEIRSLSERLYKKEYSAEFAQAMLGHKTASMTAKYDDLRGSEYQIVSTR